MTKLWSTLVAVGLAAAIGLAALSPLQPAGAVLSAGVVALWSGPAMAQEPIAGVGVIVRKNPGGVAIIAPTDTDGAVRLTGLEAGDYEVRLMGARSPLAVKVGRGGTLALVASQESAKPAAGTTAATRQRLEQIPFEKGKGELFVGAKGLVDVNKSSADRLLTDTNNGNDAAAFIIAERRSHGPYLGLQDFARRVCAKVSLDFAFVRTQVGDTMIVPRSGDPKSPGFQCARGGDELEFHNRRHHYAGSEFLLR